MEKKKIEGNRAGIAEHLLTELSSWQGYILDKSQLIDAPLANALANITAKLNREIAVYINRSGRVVHMAIGTDHTVPLEERSRRRSPDALSGLRCVHTHPASSGVLSGVDFSALEELCLDCIVAIGVKKDGTIADFGLAWHDEGQKGQQHLFSTLDDLMQIDFTEYMTQSQKDRVREERPQTQEKALLVSLSLGRNEEAVDLSLDELSLLAKTADLTVMAKVVQKKERPDAACYIGKGKAQEISLLAQQMDIDLILLDDEISPAQTANLINLTGKKVIDRTMLILSIFAQRARSSEGKLQVELAQLKYLLPRLTGQGQFLSRLGGGIGTRGPGESKLEMDRRKIRRRIFDLEEKLEQVRRTRELHRQKRSQDELPIVALVGYTNAGKSTLLNTLCREETFAEDLLFATLDPLTRRVQTPRGIPFLLVDTVGFIRRLPHHLVAAFRATLEEVCQADLLLHVIDASAPDFKEQIDAVMAVLKELDAADKPMIQVLNKADLLEHESYLKRLNDIVENSIVISAKEKEGIDALLLAIEQKLPEKYQQMELLLPYSAGSLLPLLHQEGKVISEEYRSDGIYCQAAVPIKLQQRFEAYRLQS